MVNHADSGADDAGRIAGLVVGGVGGAKIGTFAIPIPVVGTFAGAVVGAMLGSGVGRFLGQVLVKAADVVVQGAAGATAKSSEKIHAAAKS